MGGGNGAQAGPDLSDWEKEALNHAWLWFSLHSQQRMNLVNFWIVSMAFLTSGLVAAMIAERGILAAGVAMGGLASTACFHRLDRRTRLLVKAAEDPISVLQERLGVASSVPGIALVARVDKAGRYSSYSSVLLALHCFVGLGFAVAALAALILY